MSKEPKISLPHSYNWQNQPEKEVAVFYFTGCLSVCKNQNARY